MTERWVKATNLLDIPVWLNMAHAVAIVPEGEGSAVSFLANESEDEGGISVKEPPEHFLFFNDAMAAIAQGFLNHVAQIVPPNSADGPGLVREAQRIKAGQADIAKIWGPSGR